MYKSFIFSEWNLVGRTVNSEYVEQIMGNPKDVYYFLDSLVTDLSIKCQKVVKNVHCNCVCFTVISDRQKQQTLTRG